MNRKFVRQPTKTLCIAWESVLPSTDKKGPSISCWCWSLMLTAKHLFNIFCFICVNRQRLKFKIRTNGINQLQILVPSPSSNHVKVWMKAWSTTNVVYYATLISSLFSHIFFHYSQTCTHDILTFLLVCTSVEICPRETESAAGTTHVAHSHTLQWSWGLHK